MSTLRNVAFIAVKIFEVIPEQNIDFKKDIEDLLFKDFAYRSPEILLYPEIWMKLDRVLRKYIDEPKEDWEKKIIDIYVGTSIE